MRIIEREFQFENIMRLQSETPEQVRDDMLRYERLLLDLKKEVEEIEKEILH